MDCISYIREKLPAGIVEFRNNNPTCLPVNGGPCILGTGKIIGAKIWQGVGEPPQLKIEGECLSKTEFANFLEKVKKLFPQIIKASLIGSRSRGTNRENSDWDVLIQLSEECYKNDIPVKNDIERWIMGHPDLRTLYLKNIDIYFQRPSGFIVRYFRSYIIDSIFELKGFRDKDPLYFSTVTKGGCIWTPLYESIKEAKVLFQR